MSLKVQFLPSDLVAAKRAYHVNKAEDMKLFKALQILEWQRKTSLKGYKKQKGLIEMELANQARDYFQCHRVFSEESFISTTTPLKRHYSGPFPSKAVLPQGKLNHLQTLLRSLRDESLRAAKERSLVEWLSAPRRQAADLSVYGSSTQLSDIAQIAKTPDVFSSDKKIRQSRVKSAPVRTQHNMRIKRPNTTMNRQTAKFKKTLPETVTNDRAVNRRPKTSVPLYNNHTVGSGHRARSALTSKQKKKEDEQLVSKSICKEEIRPVEKQTQSIDRESSITSLHRPKEAVQPGEIIEEGDILIDHDKCSPVDNQHTSKCIQNKSIAKSSYMNGQDCQCRRYSRHQASTRKRKKSIFKRKSITSTLYGQQVAIESDMREKVSKFVGVQDMFSSKSGEELVPSSPEPQAQV